VMATPEALEVAESVPQGFPVLLQSVPESDQVTPAFAGSFWIVAVKEIVELTCVVAGAGLGVIATEMGGGGVMMVIVAVPDFVVSALEVAVSVTVLLGAGCASGAV